MCPIKSNSLCRNNPPNTIVEIFSNLVNWNATLSALVMIVRPTFSERKGIIASVVEPVETMIVSLSCTKSAAALPIALFDICLDKRAGKNKWFYFFNFFQRTTTQIHAVLATFGTQLCSSIETQESKEQEFNAKNYFCLCLIL